MPASTAAAWITAATSSSPRTRMVSGFPVCSARAELCSLRPLSNARLAETGADERRGLGCAEHYTGCWVLRLGSALTWAPGSTGLRME